MVNVTNHAACRERGPGRGIWRLVRGRGVVMGDMGLQATFKEGAHKTVETAMRQSQEEVGQCHLQLGILSCSDLISVEAPPAIVCQALGNPCCTSVKACSHLQQLSAAGTRLHRCSYRGVLGFLPVDKTLHLTNLLVLVQAPAIDCVVHMT